MVPITIATWFTTWNLFIKMMGRAVIRCSACLMFKALMCWNAVSRSGCNWKVFVGQIHLTPERGQPQLNDLVQHTAGNSSAIHCHNKWLWNKYITATDINESESIQNIYKSCAKANGESFSNYINNLKRKST